MTKKSLFSDSTKKLIFKLALVTFLTLLGAIAFGVVAPTVYFYIANRDVTGRLEELRQEGLATPPRVIPAQVSFTPDPPQPPAPKDIVLVDKAGDGTENNYLARIIAHDIERQSWAGLHPSDSVSAVEVKATVNWSNPPYGSEFFFTNWPSTPELDLIISPLFAWDAREYSKIATGVMGKNHPAPSTLAVSADSDQFLKQLLEPTGRTLAQADVILSARLQKNPLDAEAQEEAALLLITMALRERYDDFRLLLCRATAHLALADALEGGGVSWDNRVAEVALRVISGREVESLPILESMKDEADCPPAVKTWVSILEMWAKEDVRGIPINADSPRLLKIVWFDILTENLDALKSVTQLEAMGAPDKITDWTHAVLATRMSVEAGNSFCPSSLDIEQQEMSEVLEAENAPAIDPARWDVFFSEPNTETVTADASGHPLVHVIGVGTFKSAMRQHVFTAIRQTQNWLSYSLGDSEGAKTFAGQMEGLYRGVPFFEMLKSSLDPCAETGVMAQLHAEKKAWDVADLDPRTALAFAFGEPVPGDLYKSYFIAGNPIGTVYQVGDLNNTLAALKKDKDWHRPGTDTDFTVDPKSRYLKQLQEMHPSSLALVEELLDSSKKAPADYALTRMSPFLDFNLHAFHFLTGPPPNGFDLADSDREVVYKKQCQLDPDTYFAYGDLIWKEGRQADAADAYRKGIALCSDQVLMSNSAQNLVDYDWAHDMKDEAQIVVIEAPKTGPE
jgi:hypothetical protein